MPDPAFVVLVTGATGFIGSHLVQALVTSGYEVHALTRHARDDNAVRWHVCDVTERPRVFKVLRDTHVNAVCHLAGVVSYSKHDYAFMQAVNEQGTRNVVDAVLQHAPDARFVHCSSVATVGSNRDTLDPPRTEKSQLTDEECSVGYIRSKSAAERYVNEAAQLRGLHAICLCPSSVVGAGDAIKGSRKTQVRAARGAWPLYTDGGANIVHVQVVVEAFLKACNLPMESLDGQRVLVVGENVTVRRMLSLYTQYGSGRPGPWLRLPVFLLYILCVVGEWLGSKTLTKDRLAVATRYHWYNGDHGRNILNIPVTSAQTAICESVEWMREKGMLDT